MDKTNHTEFFEDIDRCSGRYVEELCDFLRIPGVSSDSGRGRAMEESAEWILEKLRALDFRGGIHFAGGSPIVMARQEYSRSAPTLLIYGHYDVQPEDPLDEWKSPPFEPTLRDGAIYARGANDDKGQFYTYLKALETYKRIRGVIPLNLIVLAEGEEEIGSKSLMHFLNQKKDQLHSDIFLVSDSSMLSKDIPAVTCGFRGIVSFEITLQTMAKDLHSGLFGGIALNAAEVLSDLLAKLKDSGSGKILVPGFYEDVRPVAEQERRAMEQLNYDEAAVAKSLGMTKLSGERGYSAMERKSIRPTLDINGMWSGFTGEGSKTVIPARASAKISARLVPDQQPDLIFQCFKDFVAGHLPAGVKADVRYLFGAMPVLAEIDDPNVRLAAESIEEGFGVAPAFIRSGGTIHIISEIKNTLKIPSMLILGWGRPENGSHSPNEHFYISDFQKAVRSLCVLFDKLSGHEEKR
ncbi:dipeptidase [Caproiciproducens sp. NJN-50]|uniref:dipeptidase n=1 Tax=Acutalibacteraceae TaxID=3082771 RepID=UPI000FFE1FEB|nr:MULTISPECIES: dipeptidase [Acutalibacteraceae]QAT48361.1 dipeptidase [Caproiciproducens sp. NJN-50]